LRPVAEGPSNLDLAELAPIHGAVVAARGDEWIAVLNAVGERAPVMGVVRPVQIGAVARGEHPAGPDVELVGIFEAGDRVKNTDVVSGAVVLRVEGDLDLVRDVAIHIQADAVEQETIGRIDAREIGVGMNEGASHAGADAHGRRRSLGAQCGGEEQNRTRGEQRGAPRDNR
jgi:hypothetical protein